MNPQLKKLQKAADGLLFLSESDHPFEVIQLSATTSTVTEQIQSLTRKNLAVEQLSIDHFLRNAIKEYPEADVTQKQTAQRFQALLQAIKEELTDVQVYRIGEVEIDAFIIGRLQDGSYGGLHTKLVET